MKEKEYPIGGFAPGNYWNKCRSCNVRFMGDKRANQCEPCAEKEQRELEEMSKEPYTEKESEKFWNAKSVQLELGDYYEGLKHPKDKAVYDRLVSLEAKIELLKTLHDYKKLSDDDYNHARSVIESEYQKLIEEHNL